MLRWIVCGCFCSLCACKNVVQHGNGSRHENERSAFLCGNRTQLFVYVGLCHAYISSSMNSVGIFCYAYDFVLWEAISSNGFAWRCWREIEEKIQIIPNKHLPQLM